MIATSATAPEAKWLAWVQSLIPIGFKRQRGIPMIKKIFRPDVAVLLTLMVPMLGFSQSKITVGTTDNWIFGVNGLLSWDFTRPEIAPCVIAQGGSAPSVGLDGSLNASVGLTIWFSPALRCAAGRCVLCPASANNE